MEKFINYNALLSKLFEQWKNSYDEDDKKEKIPVGKQVQFAGSFPADNPRYTICVVADKHSLDTEPSILQDVVNPLARFLKVYTKTW